MQNTECTVLRNTKKVSKDFTVSWKLDTSNNFHKRMKWV